jgi:hypothetical protein
MSETEAGAVENRDPGIKVMRLRYAGVCERCEVTVPAGSTAAYDPARKKIRCLSCIGQAPEPASAPPLSSGMAGASAAREYDRRSQRHQRKVEAAISADAQWREEIKRDHPVRGRVAAALTAKPTRGPEPQHVSAWKAGADGERKVGGRLDAWARETGGIVLHDRRIPPGKGNIDHIALNSDGVWVIDAKEYSGMVSVSGGLFSRAELRVGGRRRTHLAEAVWTQVERVAHALDAAAGGRPRPPVYGVLCFVGADWPVFGGTSTVKGVTVAWPAATVKLLTPKASSSGPTELERWARVLANAFPPA